MTKLYILPQKPFYLVRHGETEANALRIAAGGKHDSPLTAKGKLQADRLATKIRDLNIRPAHIYHSTLSRARDTAHIANTHVGVTMSAHDDLIEHVFGEWEGVSWDMLRAYREQGITDPPGGETMDAFSERIIKIFTAILAQEHDTPPMMVAHGGVFNAMGHAYGLQRRTISNCEMHFYEPDNGNAAYPWRVTILHTEDEGLPPL